MSFKKSFIALFIINAISSNAIASGVRADIPYQYYRDLAENKGAFTVGARNVKVYDNKQNLVGVMFDKAPMADFSTIYTHYGVATLVDPQFITSVAHNIGYAEVEFGSNNYHLDNPKFEYLMSNRFDDPEYLEKHGAGEIDYHNPKLHRLVTESAPVPMLDTIGASLNDKERFPLILRAGSGLQSRFNITKTAEGKYIYMPKEVLAEFGRRKGLADEKEKELKAKSKEIEAVTNEEQKKVLQAQQKAFETEFKALKENYKEIEDQYKIPVSGPYQFLTGGALQDLRDNQTLRDGKAAFVSGGGPKSVYENSKGQGGPLVSYIQGGDSGSGVQIYDATRKKWFIVGLGDAVVNPGALEPTFTIINTQVRPNQFKENKNSYAHTEVNNPTAGQTLNFSPSTDSANKPVATIKGGSVSETVALLDPSLKKKKDGVHWAYKEYDTGRALDISGQNGTLMLTDNIDQGAGGLYFHTDFTVDAQRTGKTPKMTRYPDLPIFREYHELTERKEKFRWSGAGVVVDEGKRVIWKLAASKAGDRLSKLGKGTLVLTPEIPYKIKPVDLGSISVGEGIVELDLPKFQHENKDFNDFIASRNKPANLQVEIVSGRPTVKVIHGSALNPQKIIFGHRGGTLDLNGNDTTFERVRHIDSGATITSKDKDATLTFKGLKRKELEGDGVLKLLHHKEKSRWNELGKDGYFYDYTIQQEQHYNSQGVWDTQTGRQFRYWYYDPSTPYFKDKIGYWPDDDAYSWQVLGTADLLPKLKPGNGSASYYWGSLSEAQQKIFTKMKKFTDVRDSLTYYAGFLGNRKGGRSPLAVKYAPELDDRLLLTGGANAKSLTVEKGSVIVQGAPVTHANDYLTKLEVVYDNDYRNPTFDFENIVVKNGANLTLSRNLTAVKGDIHLEEGAKATLGYSRGDKTYIASRARGGWRENSETFTEKGFAAMPQTQIRGRLQMDNADVTFGSKADYEGVMNGTGRVELNRGSQVLLASDSNFTGKFTAHNEVLNLDKSTGKWESDATISHLFIDKRTVTDKASKLTVQNGANLTINEASNTGDFELAGDLQFAGDKQIFDVQNFIGKGGRIHYRTNTADSTTDRVNVAKNATGTATFVVDNSGKEPTATTLTLMDVKGENSLNATLHNDFVDLGAYRYTLENKAKNGKIFSLERLDVEEKRKAEAEKARVEAEKVAQAKREAEAEKARVEAEKVAQAKREAEAEKARVKAEKVAQAKREAEAEKARIEAEKIAQEKREAEVEKARLEAEKVAEAKRKAEAEQARVEAEKVAQAKREVEAEKARVEAEKIAQAKREAEAEKARVEAEKVAQAKREAEAEKARVEAEKIAQAKREAEAEQARVEAEKVAQAKREVDAEKARLEAEKVAQAKREAEAEKARVKAEKVAQAKREAEAEKARVKAEKVAQAKREAEAEKARVKAEKVAQAKREAEVEKARLEAEKVAEAKRKAEAEQARVEAEKVAQAKREAEAEKARVEAEKIAQAKREAEAEKARVEAEKVAQAKREAEAEQARVEAEKVAQAKREAEAEKARVEAEKIAQAKREAEAEQARVEAEKVAQAKREVDAEKARLEAEKVAQAKREAEAEKARVEAEKVAQAKREAEVEKARVEAEKVAQAKREAEAEKARVEAEKIAQEKREAEAKKSRVESENVKQADIISRYSNTGISEISAQVNQLLQVDSSLDMMYLNSQTKDVNVWVKHDYQKTDNSSDYYRQYQQDLNLTQIGVEKLVNSVSLGAVISQGTANSQYDDGFSGKLKSSVVSLFVRKWLDNGASINTDVNYSYNKHQITAEGQTQVKRHIGSVGVMLAKQWNIANAVLKTGVGTRYHYLPDTSYQLNGATIHTESVNLFTYQLAVEFGQKFAKNGYTFEPTMSLHYVNASRKDMLVYVNSHQLKQNFGQATRVGLGMAISNQHWSVKAEMGQMFGDQIKHKPFGSVTLNYNW
ncbi:Immunoglobulin A1 protease autotransporter precursor [Phocoenobacter uteri]|uniref:Immunoglobulin A1 protease autotransporter n=1 Tax=Phocoenobacter uteri TaxID=146806 RepID=A0A379C9Q9_9PAST|nr:S6 family peptidase [Phocoenobacter uteri]MDG6882269.1 hypothetical protein [Phocoenobacter uteri]SUB58426.1 Immunoglobulin A1 protease autotransporter precursor [Phocoenobacter uteri]